MSGWEAPETAAYYEAFCSRYSRYAKANRALIANAQIVPGIHVLDIGAGTGRTADAVLQSLGRSGSVLCFEPSSAMRTVGMHRISDPRVRWAAALPGTGESFDRILCGAAIWLFHPLPEILLILKGLLRRGGALCFNIPAVYLREPDEPGGGSDPSLLALMELLLAGSEVVLSAQDGEPLRHEPLTQDTMTAWLRDAGLRPCPWSFRLRITQIEYANWLKIPVLTEQLLGGLPPQARAERIDEALQAIDHSSWKLERWRGWTAWKE